MRQISSDKIEKIIKFRQENNYSTPHIARLVGVCNQSVYKILRSFGPWDKSKGRVKAKNEWTAREIHLLRSLYPSNKGRADIEKMIPNRKWENITKKANSLGLRRRRSREPPPTILPLIKELYDARVSRKWNRVVMAKKIGCLPGQICNWELGHQIPSVRCISEWAQALDLELTLKNRTNRRATQVGYSMFG